MTTTKVETIRRPRNVIERLLDGVERVTVIRERESDPTIRKHVSRALDEAKTAAADNDGDRIMRAIRLLESIAAKHVQADDAGIFQWQMFMEPKTLQAAGHVGLALLAEGFRIKGQNVPVNSETGNYLVDQYVRGDDADNAGEVVHVKLPAREERRLVMLA